MFRAVDSLSCVFNFTVASGVFASDLFVLFHSVEKVMQMNLEFTPVELVLMIILFLLIVFALLLIAPIGALIFLLVLAIAFVVVMYL